MTTATALPMDVILGVPEPIRSRWQPLRAGILNLFLYDEQVFAFHNGRLLLRGNNGTGKSMALEVLLPYLLDAELTPSRLSTFGGRDRSMHLWLIGFDKTGARTSERGYTWVEFGRRLPDGRNEYFSVGAMLEGTRDGPVKAHYFTTAARIGIHFSVGKPGIEPLNAKLLGAALTEQAVLGRPGHLHPDATGHRAAVNDTLYRLSDARYAALRRTLLQLRRPKLSDKLDEKGLSSILRDSLPPVSDVIVEDLAEGFERLDRHAAAVADLEETIRNLRRIRDVYRRYARIASAARADAVAAAETAITTVGERTAASLSARKSAESALTAIKTRQGEIGTELARLRGRITMLTRLEAYQKGQDVEPLRELVTSLRTSAEHAAERAQGAEQASNTDAASAARAIEAAVTARDNRAYERDQTSVRARAAHTHALDAQLATELETLTGADIPDDSTTERLLTIARALITRLDAELGTWSVEVKTLGALSGDAQKHVATLETARSETNRARTEADEAEEALNKRLEEDSEITLAWVSELGLWAKRSVQLRAGQAPPLPWDPATAFEHAPRWAAAAATARIAALAAEQKDHLVAAGERDTAAGAAVSAAERADEIADLLMAAGHAAAAHVEAMTAHRDAVLAWAAMALELSRGEAAPDPETWPLEGIHEAAADWATRASTTRTRALLVEQAAVGSEIERVSGVITQKSATERHLADGGLPEPIAPPTRQAGREGRAGAPFYMLVDFTSNISETDQLGIEAAALGSGIADAWLSPDGRLLSSGDGELLLDSQLDAWAALPATPTLADVLVADERCATAGVPADVVTSVLTRVACTRSAQASRSETHLVLGRDGSWRAGVLTGAHQVDAVTLIGASNRETARLSALAEIRRQLEEQRDELRELESWGTEITASLTRLDSERASLPGNEEVRRLRGEAQEAASGASRAASETQATIARSALNPQPVTELDEALSRAEASDLIASIGVLTAEVLAAPSVSAPAVQMRALAEQARALAAAWTTGAAALRARAGDCSILCMTVEDERAAIPDATPVRETRANIAAATADLAGMRSRVATREKEEASARQQSEISGAALRTALLANSLPDDCDTGALAEEVGRYRSSAGRWLRAGIDELRTASAAQLAQRRSIASAETAGSERAEADRQAQQLLEKETELSTLVSEYGSGYQQIVTELEQFGGERERLESEEADLRTQETTQIAARATAEAALTGLEQQRVEAEDARTGATAAFLAAHRLSLIAIAGLPDAPPRGDTAESTAAQPGIVTSLGLRAGRDWARAVREAVGDRVTRDAVAVEAAANRVNEIRYQLEPNLAGKVSVRDEHRDGLLVVQASRGTHSLALLDMIAVLADEHARDQQLLAQHEAELFRMFLADTTRREVTTKVRDARTAIKSMSALISGHPTGSGIQVRLNWVPDEKNAPGMQDIVALMAKDAPLESERARLQQFFRSHLATVRASPDADYKVQMGRLLDYRQWWRFIISFRRNQDQPYEPLTSKAHGSLSGGEKAVCLHLPLFAAAASYCNSAGIRSVEPDGSHIPGSPRLILLDEVFAGVDEDNRGDLFELIRTLDLDMVATSESEQGFYRQLDGLAVYHLISAADAILGTRTLWDGSAPHRMLDLGHDMGAEGEPRDGRKA